MSQVYVGSVNTLPNANDFLCEVHVAATKGKSFADTQPEHSRNRNDCAEWLGSVSDNLPHFGKF